MNKARGQKKDVTRILKAMKLEQSSTKYYETVNQDSLNTVQNKNYGQTIVYAASNKRSQNSRGTKRRNYRYEKNMGENQQSYSLGYRQQRSLQVRKDNYFKISQKFDETGAINPRNPYLDRKRLQSIKPMRRSSNQGRRNYTQQSSNNVPLAAQHKKRNFHFNTIESSYNQMDPTNLIEQAKTMANNGSIVQSEMLIQKVLREDPDNKQALYVSGCNNFKQMNYLRCITALNTLLQIDPSFNKNAFVMCSICYSNKGQKEEAMLRINTCLSYFPDFYDAHFQKAKLYLKIDDTPNAVKSLKKALRLAKDPYECCFKLGQCYQKQGMYDLALKLYQKLTKHPNYGKSQEQAACLLKKAQCQKKLKKFKQYCQTLQAYLKKDRNQIINIANIYYEIGYAYYKLQDYSNAMMNLEEVFIQKSKKQSTDALILLTIINIKKRDFYEAHHSLQRKIHLDVSSQELEYYQKFCEGVLCLMKRKFQAGLEKLLEIESQTSQVFKDEFEEQISAIFPMYLAYAYFCFGRTDKCIKIYSSILKQKKDQLMPHVKGIQFNLKLCEGIQECKHKKLGAAKACFEKSVQIYPHKSEGYIYLAVTLIQMFLKDYNQSIIKKARAVLISCVKNLKQLNNNYAASILYVKAALQAFLGNWTDALDDITDSIQRAQDNDAKSFYLKALILACCQNYKQAISDASIAISLDAKQPSYYLLRSKCQQIEGDGNRAFMDLQQYIALSPEDSQIHKFAGHLLFQNGAFEDALQAYDNGQISVDISNYDVFLTRSKTYFLLGEFSKCVSDMQTAHKLKPSDPNISFDICILKILEEFFSQHKSNNLFAQKAEKAKEQLQNLAAVGEDIDYGKIFKKIQISMLVSVFLFYMGRYKQSARQFKQTLTMKQASFTNNQSEFEQQLKQKQFFVSQMHHNRAICFLMISEYQAALKALQGCNIQSETKTYSRLAQLMDCIKNKKGNLQPIQIFSQKNKMSRMLNEVSIKLGQKQVIKIKLSIPFPKVEPPEINPKFELQILRQIDVEKIQKKPEAPWILRQLQSICFTEKIEKFSRLEMNNSEISKVDKQKQNMRTQQQENENQIENSQYENSFESMEQLREKLKLDGKIEDKLNKILGKRKQADIMKDIKQ